MLTRQRFLFLTLLAHACFAALLVLGTWAHWVASFVLFVVFTLISTVFYHRLLSHRAWRCSRWLEVLGVSIGTLNWTGTPITRTAVHRAHHAFVDTPQDPHSPVHTKLLHMYLPQLQANVQVNIRLAADVMRDPIMRHLHTWYLAVQLTLLIIVLMIDPMLVLVWGAANTMVWFNIFICNYFCHSRGLRDSDLLGALTFGEGQHKHHHKNPTDPRFGSYDLGWAIIKVLRR